MITLSNGHVLLHVAASGVPAFGDWWPWEKPLVYARLIKPELFTLFIKTLTLKPTKGNLKLLHPWTCIRPIKGGTTNIVGLTNPGFEYWRDRIAPHLDYKDQPIAGSIYGSMEDLVEMAHGLNKFPLVATEVNCSCPNTVDKLQQAEVIVDSIKAVAKISKHPVIAKLSYNQPYLEIAGRLKGIAEAVSLNSVPWETVFPGQRSPLWKLQERIKSGGGGVSGRPAQKYNWKAVAELIRQDALPVIAPSIMSYNDLMYLDGLGAGAFSYGAIFIRNPFLPTKIVEQYNREKNAARSWNYWAK